MTSRTQPQVRPRRVWGDVRFLLGIGLIALSIAGVWAVVAAAQTTVPMLAASRTIVPGEKIDTSDLRIVDVALGQIDAYLSPDALPADAVALRTIESGELVPSNALGAPATASSTTITLTSSIAIPGTVDTGSTVEIWATPLSEAGAYGAPRILIGDAIVALIDEEDAVIGQSGTQVEVVIPRADVADVLDAIAQESRISIVPTGGAAP
ncbi:hypothetical protein FHX49_001873 [Microbacterium endophyticum]|uniref:SAF domain-containing protein n=1 Tax=Microbacterium endophyticum TaxID=1526412 RepID=A0A7W4YN76_9MICO|nr:hypothetical protein [Microbacterium endophyticum]MBB2976299.1 hypothetical protein [Microbacterium endophyticum]NIK35179.1 hypothetical protein [Microbacterium endophyticum]